MEFLIYVLHSTAFFESFYIGNESYKSFWEKNLSNYQTALQIEFQPPLPVPLKALDQKT